MRSAATGWRDLLALSKPHITLLAVLTSGGGIALARGQAALVTVVLTLAGTALLVAGANALNMLLERDTDRLMERTRERPLPARRMRPAAALVAGLGATVAALLLLAAARPLSAAIGALALLLYVGAYTPLKRRTPWALLVGALAGATPPLIGSSAVAGGVDLPGGALSGLLVLWQVPHFLAIAIFRREEYARAGIRTVAGVHGARAAKGLLIVVAMALVPTSLLLPLGVGWIYGAPALLCGLGFAGAILAGLRAAADAAWARRIFRLSLLYLPCLTLALTADLVLR
jgi:heme o synthase